MIVAAVLSAGWLTAQQQAGSPSQPVPREGVVRTAPRMHPTIHAAIIAASPGDRIVLSPGTCIENVDLLDKRMLIEGASTPEVTRIDGNGRLPPTLRASDKSCSLTTPCNLTLIGGTNSTRYADTWEWDGVAWSQLLSSTNPTARNTIPIPNQP